MGPGPTITPNFFLKLADPTAFSPQILTNTVMPCVQLEYLREIWRHSIKKSSLKPTLPSDFFFKMAIPTVSLFGRHISTTPQGSYLEYLKKICRHCFIN